MTPEEVAARWGTPAYVYDLAETRQAYLALRAALPRASRLYYSLKANPHPDVVRAMVALGAYAEVSSLGEFEIAERAGCTPTKILITGPGKSSSQVSEMLSRGVRRFSIESVIDLERVAASAKRLGVTAEVLLRINGGKVTRGVGLAMTGIATRFGVDLAVVESSPELFRGREGATLRGIHLYSATNLTDVDTLMRQFAETLVIAARLVALLGPGISEVDLGGGFGAPYARTGTRPDLSKLKPALTRKLDSRLPGWRCQRPLISFESGRFLTAASGTLICRVLDVKQSHGRTFVVLDAGIHQLGGMSGLRRIPRIVPDVHLACGTAREQIDDCSVVGPLCTPLDTWSSGVRLPRVRPGDLVTVPNVGAYGLTASLVAFLGHPPAVEIVHDGGRFRSASRLTLMRTAAESHPFASVPDPA